MRVVVHLTLNGMKETILEGDSAFLSGATGDELEQKGLGIWLSNWRTTKSFGVMPVSSLVGAKRKGRAFIPWSSALFIEEVEQ